MATFVTIDHGQPNGSMVRGKLYFAFRFLLGIEATKRKAE